MKKMIATIFVLTATVSGAVTLATAENGISRDIVPANAPAIASKVDTYGITRCESQVWPQIDQICLTPAAEQGGVVREARVIEM
jgi:hypothetical protein